MIEGYVKSVLNICVAFVFEIGADNLVKPDKFILTSTKYVLKYFDFAK